VKPIESVVKASTILKAFEPGRRLLTVRELAARTGISRSTCHMVCATLEGEELLEKVPGGGYRLGPALAVLGGQVIERAGLVEAALPAMHQLSREERGEVHLGQLVSSWVVYLHRIEMDRRLPMRNRKGLRAPAHLTGCGQAALSALNPERALELLRLHEDEEDLDVDEVMQNLERARAAGYAVSDRFQPGVVSVAAPLRGPGGSVLGGISVARSADVMDARRTARVGAAVIRAAGTTSERLKSLVWKFG
jgi:IclR family acetate operon transcriptional repressor